MANGRTHGRVTFVLALGTGYIILKSLGMTAGLAGMLGCLAGLFVDPDLDIAGPTRSRYRVKRAFGPLSWLWAVVWWPYARVIPHRHPLSHWPILGTAVRVAYLAALLCVLLVMLEAFFGFGLVVLEAALLIPSAYWLMGIAGLAVSDAGHWLADRI